MSGLFCLRCHGRLYDLDGTTFWCRPCRQERDDEAMRAYLRSYVERWDDERRMYAGYRVHGQPVRKAVAYTNVTNDDWVEADDE